MSPAQHPLRTTLQILLLWTAGLGAATQFAKISLSMATLAATYPTAGTHLGFVVSLLSVVGIVMGLAIGSLISRFGYRKALLGGLLLGATISAWQACLPSLPWLLLSRLFEGISHLLIVVSAPTLISLLAHGRARSLGLTLWSTFFGVAFALYALLVPLIITGHGLPGVFVTHSASLVIIAMALAFMLPGDKLGMLQSTPALQADSLRSLSGFLTLHLNAYRRPGIAVPALGWMFYTMTFVALLTVLPNALPVTIRQELSVTLPLISIASAWTLGSFLLTRCSPITLVAVGFCMALVAAVGLMIDSLLPVAAMALFAAFGLIQAGSFAAIPSLNDSARTIALGNGGIAQTGNLGNTIGTPLMLWLYMSLGMPGIVLMLVFSYALASLLYLRMRSKLNVPGATSAPAA